jgi:hypothetical protein
MQHYVERGTGTGGGRGLDEALNKISHQPVTTRHGGAHETNGGVWSL